MYQLTVHDEEGKTLSLLVPAVLTIGRQEGNGLRLCEKNVSRHHARLLCEADRLLIEDLGSFNGTAVNGLLIAGRTALGSGDHVRIGDFELSLSQLLPTPLPPPPPSQVPPPEPLRPCRALEPAQRTAELPALGSMPRPLRWLRALWRRLLRALGGSGPR